MSTYMELVNRAEAAALAAEQSALNTANNKTIVQGLLGQMQGIVANTATLPVPSIQVDPSTGIVTASYTATAGNVLSSTQRIGTLDISSLLGIEFYKCASVDTTNHTWTGYKAVLTDGSYIFEVTATTGLTYGSAYTPSVDGIYNDGASIKVEKMYIDPLAAIYLYEPFTEQQLAAETGQTMTVTGTPVYETIDGRACVALNSSTNIAFNGLTGLPAPGEDITLALFYRSTHVSANFNEIFNFDSNNFWIMLRQYEMQICGEGGRRLATLNGSDNVWYHFAITYSKDADKYSIYLNGVLQTENTGYYLGSTRNGTVRISGDDEATNNYVADLRIYNSCLTATEVAALAAGA